MGYDLDAIRKKIEQLSSNKKSSNTNGNQKDRPKINWFKPTLGQIDVRFLPYSDSNGQPFQEIAYYDSKLLSDRRFVTPNQFGEEDPVFDLLTQLRKDRSKEAWKLWRNLQPKERYYAPILVRNEEDKGIQIWEISPTLVKDIYAILAHPDYRDENLMDPENGYDFTVLVSATDKTFNGFAVKEIKFQPRRKSSPILKESTKVEALLAGMPNLEAYFKSQIKTKEEMEVMLENFMGSNSKTEDAVVDEDNFDAEKLVEKPSSSAKESAKTKNAKKTIDDAFDDL